MSMRKTMYSIFTSSSIFSYLILSSFDILLSSLSIVYLFLNFYPISHLLWFAIPFLLLHYLPSFSSLYSYPPYFVPLTSYLFQSPFFGDPLLTSLFLSCVFFFPFPLALSSHAPVWSKLAASGEWGIWSIWKWRRGKRYDSQHLYGVHRQW